MCGWNEPERVNVQSVVVKVDEHLRAGYARLTREKRALPWIGPKTIDYRPHSEAQQANSGGENTG